MSDQNYHFVPFVVETMGSWGTEAIKLFTALSRMMVFENRGTEIVNISQTTNKPSYEKGNAAAVMGRFQPTGNLKEVFYL